MHTRATRGHQWRHQPPSRHRFGGAESSVPTGCEWGRQPPGRHGFGRAEPNGLKGISFNAGAPVLTPATKSTRIWRSGAQRSNRARARAGAPATKTTLIWPIRTECPHTAHEGNAGAAVAAPATMSTRTWPSRAVLSVITGHIRATREHTDMAERDPAFQQGTRGGTRHHHDAVLAEPNPAF